MMRWAENLTNNFGKNVFLAACLSCGLCDFPPQRSELLLGKSSFFWGWNDPAAGTSRQQVGWTGVMRVGAISFLPSGASQQELRLTHQCNTPHPHHPFIIAPTFYFTSISCRSFIDVFLSTLFRWPDTPPQVNLHMFSKLSLNCHSTFWSSTTAAWIGDNLFVTSQVHVTFIL